MKTNVDFVSESNSIISQPENAIFFLNKRWKYIYNPDLDVFERLK